jgi:hypothetical protein
MPPSDLSERVAALNDRYRHHSAISVLEHALRDPEAGRLALVSSFGAESVVLLHMVSVTRAATPVIFIDTEMLFAETICASSARTPPTCASTTPTTRSISAIPMPVARCARPCPCSAR